MSKTTSATMTVNLADSSGSSHHIRHDLPTYALFLIASFAVVSTAVAIQAHFVLKQFEPRLLVVPSVMATVIGLLLARITILSRRLRRRTEQLRAVADFALEFTYFRNNDGSYDYVSPAVKELTGYSSEEFYATPNLMSQLVHPEDRPRWEHHVHHMECEGSAEALDLRLMARDGREVWITHMCAPVFDNNSKLVGQRSTNIDITQRKNHEAQIEQMAYFDALTGLPNRNLLDQFLRGRITMQDPEHEQPFALLFLNLHRFSHINDSLGHAFGDKLLVEVAKRLMSCCRNDGMVSRFGGDEFLIVVPRVDDSTSAELVAQHLLDSIEQPFMIDAREIFMTGSIGIALFPEDGRDAETLIRNADAAMCRSRRDRDNHICVYHPRLVSDASDFVTLEHSMRRGLGRSEFHLAYQPKVSMESGKIIALEALVRWNLPGHSPISPSQFIPVAEETGLIRPLGEKILHMACEQMCAWHEAGLRLPVSVNVSGRQFSDKRFCDTVRSVVGEHGCDPSLLTLEVTEQVFMRDMESTIKRINKIREHGITFALDDFGTGFSSLSYLKQLPLDEVKIDMSFIRDIARDGRNLAIVKSIILLCKDLDMATVAEGIEHLDQHELLSSMGCDLGQGFYYHKPLSVDELNQLLVSSAA